MWNAKAMHYVVDGRSLCGNWLYLGTRLGPEMPPHIGCKACRKKLDKRHELAFRALLNFFRKVAE